MTEETLLDPERQLALAYVRAPQRAALRALWILDATLGSIVAASRQPMVSQIKLAWWRDALAALDHAPPPAEPVLQQIAFAVLPGGVNGAQLAELTAGWEYLLDPDPLAAEELRSYAHLRGALLFRFSGTLLGGQLDPHMERAGEGWALADLARRSSRSDERAAALAEAALHFQDDARWPTRLRPLGMLAALARRDARRGAETIEPPAAPARIATMLLHRISGR